MMKLARIFIAVFMVLVATACTASTGQLKDSPSVQDGSQLKQLVLEVSTITCSGCTYRVKASAKSVLGVVDVKFDRNKIQKVTIVYGPEQTNPATIIAAIEKRGDKATVITE